MTDTPRMKIIACQTVGEELRPLLPDGFILALLEYGLHNVPQDLHARLQAEIDSTVENVDTILFGYGLCANAIIGLKSRRFRLVFPRVDDCIALFLGSREEYLKQFRQVPGTYYLTRGWIECGDDPYTEYCAMRDRYGHEKALRITKQYIANYTRLALIKSESHNQNLEAYRKYARMVADHFMLDYEEIPGSNALLERLIRCEWERDFVTIEPGQIVQYDMFYTF